MATVTGFTNIEKLKEDNYELWKIQMKSVLVFNDLWPYVDGTSVKKPTTNADVDKRQFEGVGVNKFERYAWSTQLCKEGYNIQINMG